MYLILFESLILFTNSKLTCRRTTLISHDSWKESADHRWNVSKFKTSRNVEEYTAVFRSGWFFDTVIWNEMSLTNCAKTHEDKE